MQKFRDFFHIPLDRSTRKQVEAALAASSCRTIRGTCWFVFAFQLLLLLSLLLWPNRCPTRLRPQYLALYAAPFPIAAAVLTTSSLALRRGQIAPRPYFLLESAYALALCLWSACVTLLDQHNGSDLNVFSYVTLAVAACTALPPTHSFAVFTGNLLFFALLLPAAPGVTDLPGSLIHAFFVYLLAFLISAALYRSKVSSLRDKAVIQEQFEVIKLQNQRLRRLALTDGLTGMNNRRFLDKALEDGRFLQKTDIAGMMVDIDFFKRYNDTYGHVRGDLGLQSLSLTIRSFLKGRDGFAVRYGGEEFFVCLFGCAKREALAAAEALRAAVERECIPAEGGPGGDMTVSIGVYAVGSWQETALPELICRADKALYQAKQQGRNRVEYFDPSLDAPDSEYCAR